MSIKHGDWVLRHEGGVPDSIGRVRKGHLGPDPVFLCGGFYDAEGYEVGHDEEGRLVRLGDGYRLRVLTPEEVERYEAFFNFSDYTFDPIKVITMSDQDLDLLTRTKKLLDSFAV